MRQPITIITILFMAVAAAEGLVTWRLTQYALNAEREAHLAMQFSENSAKVSKQLFGQDSSQFSLQARWALNDSKDDSRPTPAVARTSVRKSFKTQ